jgi:hypothetical protein
MLKKVGLTATIGVLLLREKYLITKFPESIPARLALKPTEAKKQQWTLQPRSF